MFWGVFSFSFVLCFARNLATPVLLILIRTLRDVGCWENPVWLLGIVHRLHMRGLSPLPHRTYQGYEPESRNRDEVGDAELMVALDYLQTRFFLYFSSHAFFTGFIHIYESAWQVEGAFGWLVFLRTTRSSSFSLRMKANRALLGFR